MAGFQNRIAARILLAGWAMAPMAAPGQADQLVERRRDAELTVALPPIEFPIGVWLQHPKHAGAYRRAGFNLYVGLWKGPTDEQLNSLHAQRMRVVCSQNELALARKTDPVIYGWMEQDEPDNLQPDGHGGYDPPVDPDIVMRHYLEMRSADPVHPVLLNLGQGVANDRWVGRGSQAKLSDYEKYVKAADVVSFDVYPVAGLGREDLLWYVPKGVDRLVKWTAGKKPLWTCIECTAIDGKAKPTPADVRAEVWMAIIHGSRGLIYFVHRFRPSLDDHALLDDPVMLKAVTAINKEVGELASVINRPACEDAASVQSSVPEVPIDMTARKTTDATFVFAAAMRGTGATGVFRVGGLGSRATAQVLGESRSIPVSKGTFRDEFGPFGVHLYRIR